MFPGLIALAIPPLGEFCASLAAEIGKKKTLSFLEKQGKPFINHHLARALVRALSGSLIEQLNVWCETPEGKQNKDYASNAIKQLKALSDETKEKNKDWTAFIENFNSTALNQILETVRKRYNQPMQVSDLGKNVMKDLYDFFCDPEKNQDALSNFFNFLNRDNGAVFNCNLYKRFLGEIKEDPVTFNAFTIDFLSQIYDGVDRAFPNRDTLTDTLSSILAERLNKIEGMLVTIPEKIAGKTFELLPSILLTKKEHCESLKELSKEIVNGIRSSSVTSEQGEQIVKTLTEIQFALSNQQGFEESYRAKIKQLEEQIAHL